MLQLVPMDPVKAVRGETCVVAPLLAFWKREERLDRKLYRVLYMLGLLWRTILCTLTVSRPLIPVATVLYCAFMGEACTPVSAHFRGDCSEGERYESESFQSFEMEYSF